MKQLIGMALGIVVLLAWAERPLVCRREYSVPVVKAKGVW